MVLFVNSISLFVLYSHWHWQFHHFSCIFFSLIVRCCVLSAINKSITYLLTYSAICCYKERLYTIVIAIYTNSLRIVQVAKAAGKQKLITCYCKSKPHLSSQMVDNDLKFVSQGWASYHATHCHDMWSSKCLADSVCCCICLSILLRLGDAGRPFLLPDPYP